VHFEAGYVPGHHSVENSRKRSAPSASRSITASPKISRWAKLLTLLLEVTGLFDMQTGPKLILLQKTMVVVEGVARGFDPKLDIWKVADPVVREWIERNLGPIGRIHALTRDNGSILIRGVEREAGCQECCVRVPLVHSRPRDQRPSRCRAWDRESPAATPSDHHHGLFGNRISSGRVCMSEQAR